MGKIFAVLSGKGGTGKSTVSVGIGLGYAKRGKKVLLIDLDEGLRCLDLMVGISAELVFDLADLLAGHPIVDGIYPTELSENLFLIPAPQQDGILQSESLSDLIQTLSPQYDIIILDFSAGIHRRLLSALPPNTQWLAVCNADPVSVRDITVFTDSADTLRPKPLLILNRFSYWNFRDGGFQTLDEIVDTGGLRLIGVIPLDFQLAQLPVRHRLPPKSRGFLAFDRIVGRLEKENIPLPKPQRI
ncbi:MAG: AAA family ATPase [Clostridia bacterium]|nr:AAA family ATPase [Clostridia bacterium]